MTYLLNILAKRVRLRNLLTKNYNLNVNLLYQNSPIYLLVERIIHKRRKMIQMIALTIRKR